MHSLHIRNVEGRVNLDPWILELVGCDLGPIRGCVLSTIININSLDGAAYSQTVYVPKDSSRAWFLQLLEVNVLLSEHLIYHKIH